MRKSVLPLAAILACGPLFSQDVFEFHGYMRSGSGMSSKGGEQVHFGLGNVGNDFRLGNEVDNYIELQLDANVYQKGSTAFKLHFMPTFKQLYSERDASIDASGGPATNSADQRVLLRQTWGEATGVFGNSSPQFKDATLWVGRRYYQRHDVHELDYFFWNNSGDGVGIENVNLGLAKFHYAIIRADFGNTANASGITVSSPSGNLVQTSHDFRFTDIATNPNGSLSLGLQLQKSSNRVNNSGNDNGGWRVDVMHNQGGIMGGDNTFEVNFGKGSVLWGWYNQELSKNNKRFEALDSIYFVPTKKFAVNLVALYRDLTIETNVNGPGTTGNQKNFLIGGRPTYFFTDHFSAALDLGYEQVKQDRFYAPGTSTTHLMKETLALQWSPQATYWSRPSLRLFWTNAQWGTNPNPNASWQTYTPSGFDQNQKSGRTFGAQIEAWW
jgi:maltoporin